MTTMIRCNQCSMFIWDQGSRANDIWRETHLSEHHPQVEVKDDE